jgi:hypothetical protein
MSIPRLIGTPEIAYHRNGVSGEGFYFVRGLWSVDGEQHMMLATVFPPDPIKDGPGKSEPDWGVYERREFDNPRVAILDEQLLPEIGFTRNSWRGDQFAPALYRVIKAHQRA